METHVGYIAWCENRRNCPERVSRVVSGVLHEGYEYPFTKVR
jgi:hypothetical protein